MRLNSDMLYELQWISKRRSYLIAGQHDLNSSCISAQTLNDSSLSLVTLSLVDFLSWYNRYLR